jgi:hypothetical protein
MQNATPKSLHPQPDPKAAAWADLPETLRLRLAAYSIHSISDWRKLGRSQRGRLFGIVSRHINQLDAIAGRWWS